MFNDITKHALGISTLLLAELVHAAPGTPSDAPLVVTGTAQPNIMLLIDNSGSMAHIVPDSVSYSSSTTYVACSSSTAKVPANAEVELRISSANKTYFRCLSGCSGTVSNNTDYDWGTNSGSTGLTSKSQRCFFPTAKYLADLNADSGSNPKTPSSLHGGATEYDGNFLNWYFSNSTRTTGDTFASSDTYKSGTLPRYKIAATSADSLVDSLSGVNLGLAMYKNPTTVSSGAGGGAQIKFGIADLTAANKTSIKSKIDSLLTIYPVGNYTPLASAFKEVGRYYFTGKDAAGTKLTLHPNNSYGATADSTNDGRNIFDTTPGYDSGVSAPTTAAPVIKYSCQKNFLIAVTDGRPNGDAAVPSVLQDYDRDCTSGSPTYAGACSTQDKKSTETYEQYGTDYMNDVAAAMYDMDLRPDLSGKQNVATYLVGFADPNLQDSTLLQTTASRGGGQFLTAGNAAALDAALASATQSIISQSAATASVAFNSSTLSTDSAVFFAKFNSAKWSGELHAIPLSDTGTLDPEDWDASAKLDAMTPTNRVIITHDGADGVPFRWSASGIDKTSPSEPLVRQDLKNDNSANNAADANGSFRLDYLRGDRSHESTGSSPLLRSRSSALGDIVDSTPVYVGGAQSNWPDYTKNNLFGSSTSSYSDFKTAQASRTPVVYVGANDGMLHGFNAQFGSANANRGKEVIGYVPKSVASALKDQSLHYLTNTAYLHRFFVDLTPSVADVYVSPDNVAANRAWRTVLVGGLRQGGKGYFALDITNPGNFTEANAAALTLWEFTANDDSDLGYSYSEPTIAMMNNGKWAVIFGNGYNSTNGIAKLFILYLEQGADGAWSASDYVKINTKAGSVASANGLSSPQAADLDGNGTVDRIYAGDLQGNMWAFDVSSNSDSAWVPAYGTAAAPLPLFTAKDSAGTAQPVTARPLLARNLDNAGGSTPNIVVMFGTGQYITTPDLTSTGQQAFYVVGDNGTGSLLRGNLLPRTFTTSGGALRSPTASQSAMSWSSYNGWYMDLAPGSASPAVSAERIIYQASLRRRTLFFNTIIPDATPCNGGGSGWLMSFDFLTGLNPAQATFDADKNGVINSSDKPYIGELITGGIPARSGILGSKQYTPASNGTLNIRDIDVGASALEGRLGWEELRAK